MKVCPKCGQVSSDDTLSYCLMDGTPLIDGNAAPTVAINDQVTEAMSAPTVSISEPGSKKKGRTGMWVAVVVVILAVMGGGIALALYSYRLGSESAKSDNKNGTGTKSQKTQNSQRATPATTSPSTDASPSDVPGDNEGDEATPITWTTSASTFEQQTGRKYKFSCPPHGTAGAIWGSDVYSSASSICTAAVHAGVITLEAGGDVAVEMRAGRQTYGATTRNGIESYNLGANDHSFVVRVP